VEGVIAGALGSNRDRGWVPCSVRRCRSARFPCEFQADPLMGQKIADRDSGIVLMHALVQLAFAVLGSWYVRFRSGNLILFLAIVIPIGAIVFLITVVGLIAK
jgi:heme A synthase